MKATFVIAGICLVLFAAFLERDRLIPGMATGADGGAPSVVSAGMS